MARIKRIISLNTESDDLCNRYISGKEVKKEVIRKEITTSTTRKNDNSSSKYDLQNLRNHETFYPFIRPCFSYLN